MRNEKFPADYIREKVELVERRSRRKRVRNKPGYLRRALEDGWTAPPAERDAEHFDRLVGAIQRGEVREGLVGGMSWRAGITADGKAIYLTHMTTGAQIRLESWDECGKIDWQ